MNTDRPIQNMAAGIATAAVLAFLSVGCDSYPEVSPAAFELAKAVDNLCNLQTDAQLPMAREHVEAKFADGEISEDERGYLLEILDVAATGDWGKSQEMSRQLLEDQQGEREGRMKVEG